MKVPIDFDRWVDIKDHQTLKNERENQTGKKWGSTEKQNLFTIFYGWAQRKNEMLLKATTEIW